MKLSITSSILLSLPCIALSFSVIKPKTHSWALASDRRAFIASVAGVSVASTFQPTPAMAAYTPRFEDMKQILNLGYSLDNLITKLSDESTVGEALSGLVAFNKDKDFYTTYARNFVGKSVKANADGDARVGAVRQASSLISSCQELLEGRQGLVGKEAADEAVKRVKQAQKYLVTFCEGSGLAQDERVAKFISMHS
eukprot:CAMPEP_0116054046 /NCGR_PEP_ID=MMETSP0322-20121206/2557_1 /TAXON_ID=163516 /ORGANISM="Leptocylindrus danicus var. apora, Strain B651" /LENGTH=196 /DNA_ID=CAMNT_0003537341 /DNA_START=15 /DNA_END=605 /DNA_ORIENTATION=-